MLISRVSRPRFVAAAISSLLIGAAGASIPLIGSAAATKTPFSISTNASTVTVAPGSSTTLTLTASRSRGFTSPIYLGARSLPRGVRLSTGANPLKNSSTTVKISIDATVALKSYTATLTASSKGKSAQRTIKIVVANSTTLPVENPTSPTTAPTAATLPPPTLPPATTAPPATIVAPTTTKAGETIDYSLSMVEPSVSIGTFGVSKATVKITRTGGFNQPLDFAVAGLPAGVTGVFGSFTTSSETVLLNLTSAGAIVGTTEVTVSARGRLAKFNLVVSASSALTATPASATVAPGASTSVSLKFLRTVPAGSNVVWAVANLPAGLTGSFVPNNTTSADTVLTLTAAAGTAASTTNLTINVTAGGVTDPVSLPLTVSGPAATVGNISPASVAIAPGASTSVVFTPGSTINLASPLTLTHSGLPTNVSPVASVSGTGLTITLNTTAATPAGTYNVTFTATQGTVLVSGVVVLSIGAAGTTTTIAPSGFSLTAGSPTLSVVRGATGGTGVIGITPTFTSNIDLVTFAVIGLPTGVTPVFSANPSSGSTTLTLTVPAATPAGTYPVAVTGTISGRGTATVIVQVIIS